MYEESGLDVSEAIHLPTDILITQMVTTNLTHMYLLLSGCQK